MSRVILFLFVLVAGAFNCRGQASALKVLNYNALHGFSGDKELKEEYVQYLSLAHTMTASLHIKRVERGLIGLTVFCLFAFSNGHTQGDSRRGLRVDEAKRRLLAATHMNVGERALIEMEDLWRIPVYE
jgi:hypothetical protein